MRPFRAIRSSLRRLADRIDERNKFVREDFADGGQTLVSYIATHRMKYQRHVGAHFITALHAQGEEAFSEFAQKQRIYGWHFPLSRAEEIAMVEARDKTSAYVQVANLRYGRNVWGQLANSKQLVRALGLGAVASTAVIAVTISEFMLFAREAVRSLVERTFGVTILDATTSSDTDAFIDLANDITRAATQTDGSLDSAVVAEKIAELVSTIEQSENVEAAVNATSGDYMYLIGVFSGISVLVIGRGLAKLIAEGFSGAVKKIDAFVHDMDDYCEFVLGRSPFPPEETIHTLLGLDVQAAQAARANGTPKRTIPEKTPVRDYAPKVKEQMAREDELAREKPRD
ncbi:MAG: hypothetical protein MK098_04915 [Marinovum sp.]|nr:hypothetical protein [Marinovum sp.]